MKRFNFSALVVGIFLFFAGILINPVLFSYNEFGDLTKFADKYGTDKGSSKHKFTEIYDHFFLPIRGNVKKLFEIGVFGGASMKMFSEYFPNAEIHGIDIMDTSQFDTKTIKTYIADQAKREELEKVMSLSGGDFDIILDDGGHTMEQQQISFGCLFRHLKSGGYYVLEDVHTSFFGKDYGVEPNMSNATITMINQFIKNGEVESVYMSPEEKKYLKTHIEYCSLVSRNSGGSITCVFKKK